MILRLIAFLFIFFTAAAADKNIIFFITDDQSPNLGCYGDKTAVTPNIDKLAADGILFENAFATTASCSASRSVVMSGVHNHLIGQYGHTHAFHKFASFKSISSLSLPLVLAKEGYRTAHIGKYHVAPEKVFHFEQYLTGDLRSTVKMADKCAAIFNSKDERHFFLYFATGDPHRYRYVDESHPGKYKPNLFGNKAAKGNYPGVKEVFFDPKNINVPAFLPDTAECRAELAQYYQSCSRIDQGFGRLMELLKKAGLYEKTLIVFTSDHGMAFPGGKTTVYEGGLKVPFVVRNPYEKKRGIISKALISHVDITPSLVDFAGALDPRSNGPKNLPKSSTKSTGSVPHDNEGDSEDFKTYQGRSWLSILASSDSLKHDKIFASHTFHEIQMYYPMRVIRDRQYKLIWNIAHQLPFPFAADLWRSSTWQAQEDKGPQAPFGLKTVAAYVQRPAFELYKIDEDPQEGNNLAENPEYAAILKKYKEKLNTYTFPLKTIKKIK